MSACCLKLLLLCTRLGSFISVPLLIIFPIFVSASTSIGIDSSSWALFWILIGAAYFLSFIAFVARTLVRNLQRRLALHGLPRRHDFDLDDDDEKDLQELLIVSISPPSLFSGTVLSLCGSHRRLLPIASCTACFRVCMSLARLSVCSRCRARTWSRASCTCCSRSCACTCRATSPGWCVSTPTCSIPCRSRSSSCRCCFSPTSSPRSSPITVWCASLDRWSTSTSSTRSALCTASDSCQPAPYTTIYVQKPSVGFECFP